MGELGNPHDRKKWVESEFLEGSDVSSPNS